ncbi:MAG: hypothetical protein IJS82_00050 [Paludibacteraceae bacterium]|nr:hypothetical protein [Paludibacteraceae bacterium]
MKANWKLALLCLATIAFVACNDKNKPVNPDDENLFGYEAPIQVNDKSVTDWDKLDQTKITEVVLPDAPLYSALKKARVYADSVCIFYQLEFDPTQMTSHTSADGLHIYINADNSDATGGFWDLFAPERRGDVDFMFEINLWDDNGAESFAFNYEYWSGPVNGEGWLWTPDESVALKVSSMQFVGDNIIEGRLVQELIPFKFDANAFTIGFDIQQNWDNVGLLPQANTPNGELIGRAEKMLVTFDK